MNLFSYIVTHDSGFAPNPFHGVCTLACCKPSIRRTASVGDWIVGLTPKKDGYRLVYAMRVQDALTFEDYWRHPKFRKKRPAGARDRGDNIYQPLAGGGFQQLPSGHSHRDGSENAKTKDRDLGGENVLISDDFVYFGSEAIKLPRQLSDLIVGRGHRRFRRGDDDRLIEAFEAFIKSLPRGVRGKPSRWPEGDDSWRSYRGRLKTRTCQ